MGTAQHCHDGNQLVCVDFLLTMVQVRVLRLILIYLGVAYRYLSSHIYPTSATLKVCENRDDRRDNPRRRQMPGESGMECCETAKVVIR